MIKWDDRPVIGDNVILFVDCKLYGDISIGNHVIVASNSVVCKDVDHCPGYWTEDMQWHEGNNFDFVDGRRDSQFCIPYRKQIIRNNE